MGFSSNLHIAEMEASQDQKEVTHNNAVEQLDNSVNATAEVSLATGNAATLTVEGFAAAGNFECTGHTAAAVMTLPAGMKRKFSVHNLGGFQVTVGYPTGASIVVPPESLVSLAANGTAVAGAESASGPGITTLDALLDVNTGSAVAGAVLTFDGSLWVPGTVAPPDLVVLLGSATAGDVLRFDGTHWAGAPADGFADLTGAATFAQLPGEAATLPLGFSHPGTMTDAEVLLIIPVNQAYAIPTGLVGTYMALDGTMPAGPTAITYDHFTSGAWVNRGTITISSAGTVAITGAPTADVTIAPGDALRFVGQATADAGFKDFGLVTMLRRL